MLDPEPSPGPSQGAGLLLRFDMTVHVSRIVNAVVLSATVSLFTTVASITAIEASKLRWDGSFCTYGSCASTAVAAVPKPLIGLPYRTL